MTTINKEYQMRPTSEAAPKTTVFKDEELRGSNLRKSFDSEQLVSGDDVKPLSPIARVKAFKETIIDMKWVLNETFLMVLTEKHHFMIFDPLLNLLKMATGDSFSTVVKPYRKVHMGRPFSKKPASQQFSIHADPTFSNAPLIALSSPS